MSASRAPGSCISTTSSRSTPTIWSGRIWGSSSARQPHGPGRTLGTPDRAQALICWNINIAASNPEQARLQRALDRDDLFTVVVDLFATDTTDHADIVLPAASFLEFDDLMTSYFDLTLSAQVKASEPLGEALPNTEIFRRLAAAMGFTEPELQESDADVIAALLEQSGVIASFDQLAAVGTVPLTAEPVVQFAELEFPTPSGRIEIASAAAEADGHPAVPQPWADKRPGKDLLRLLTPASQWMLNDTFTNDPKITKRLGPAEIALNPADAFQPWSDRWRSGGGCQRCGHAATRPAPVRRRAAGGCAIAQRPLAQT